MTWCTEILPLTYTKRCFNACLYDPPHRYCSKETTTIMTNSFLIYVSQNALPILPYFFILFSTEKSYWWVTYRSNTNIQTFKKHTWGIRHVIVERQGNLKPYGTSGYEFEQNFCIFERWSKPWRRSRRSRNK